MSWQNFLLKFLFFSFAFTKIRLLFLIRDFKNNYFFSQIELLNCPQKRRFCSSELVQTAEENNITTCKTIGPRRK